MASAALLISLKTANLLPSKLIPQDFTPSLHLTISFPSGLTPQNGDLARVSQVKHQPTITVSLPPSTPPHPLSGTYTFMQIDPDAPTPSDPKYGFWRHWLVSRIPGAALTGPHTGSIVDAGTTLTAYLPPGPKDDSGPHRYLFLLFREAGGAVLGKRDIGGEEFVERRGFRAEEVVAGFGLELVGVQWMRGVGDGWVAGKEEL
ncbi:hypothetical protein ACN47E_000695 [Coniothyrium glycines]